MMYVILRKVKAVRSGQSYPTEDVMEKMYDSTDAAEEWYRRREEFFVVPRHAGVHWWQNLEIRRRSRGTDPVAFRYGDYRGRSVA